MPKKKKPKQKGVVSNSWVLHCQKHADKKTKGKTTKARISSWTRAFDKCIAGSRKKTAKVSRASKKKWGWAV